jgi:hypothetical protein
MDFGLASNTLARVMRFHPKLMTFSGWTAIYFLSVSQAPGLKKDRSTLM